MMGTYLHAMELMVVVVGVYKRWTHVQLALQRKKRCMLKILSQKKHVTKGGHNYGKVEGLQVQKVGMVGNLGGVGGPGAKVARWHM
jgi:hypothetical protein